MNLPPPTKPQSAAPSATLPDQVTTRDLFRDRQVVLIEHAGERYQLRLTRNGKLILTK